MKYEENLECKVNIILSVKFAAPNVMSDFKLVVPCLVSQCE